MSDKKINMPEIFELENITLKKATFEYAEAVYQSYLDNLEHFKQFSTKKETVTIEVINKRIEDAIADWENKKRFAFCIFDKSGQNVGNIVLIANAASCAEYEFGYALGQEHEGKGYVSQSVECLTNFLFKEVEVSHRLMIRCNVENHKSIKVALRAGFLLESLQYGLDRGQNCYCFLKLKNNELMQNLKEDQDDLKRIYNIKEF